MTPLNATVYEILKRNGTGDVKTTGILSGEDFLIHNLLEK